jgi:hypothetical protein
MDISEQFEEELEQLVHKHFIEIGLLLQKRQHEEHLTDKDATLILMWYIRTLIIKFWREPIEQEGKKVSEILEQITQAVKEMDEV